MPLVDDILSIVNIQDNENAIANVIRLVDTRMPELDETSIKALFSLYNDKTNQDLLWELLHLLESIDDHLYIHGFVNSIEVLEHNHAKEWIETISCRILNSHSLDVALRKELQQNHVALNIFTNALQPISQENRKASQTIKAFLSSL